MEGGFCAEEGGGKGGDLLYADGGEAVNGFPQEIQNFIPGFVMAPQELHIWFSALS
jgi:hypothetical protein